MKKGDLVLFTGHGTSPLEGLLGVLLEDSYDQHGCDTARIYFANAPKWPERIINVKWLRLIHESR